MVSVVYCTRQSNPEHKEHLIKSSGMLKNLEVIEIINNGESLTTCYNRGLNQAKNDIVVFCHDDITIETKQWGEKLMKLFKKNEQYAILGVAGTKFMPASGRWWENPKKMYGKVAHTHEGKTWLSSYSADLGKEIEETVIVDGVFFAVDKTKLKKQFNEEVEGFHFYDITFCYENYLEGVKIGVTTVIRINHKSIGMTNEQWEKNREIFSEKFKETLPVSLKRVLRKNEQLKIMLTVLTFDDNSPKASAVLELANKLISKHHNVTICANMGGKIPMSAKKSGVQLSPIQQPPGFALGDGKWKINTPNGEMVSQPNTLYKVKNVNFDVIHCFDDEIIDHMNKLYAGTSILNTRFPNGLFVNLEQHPLVSKTIDMSTDINDVKNISIDDIITTYVDTL